MSLMRSCCCCRRSMGFREHATHYCLCVAQCRFMPAKRCDGLRAEGLRSKRIERSSTHLGEISRMTEARRLRKHLEVLNRSRERIEREISVKLTQLGLDLSADLCFEI